MIHRIVTLSILRYHQSFFIRMIKDFRLDDSFNSTSNLPSPKL